MKNVDTTYQQGDYISEYNKHHDVEEGLIHLNKNEYQEIKRFIRDYILGDSNGEIKTTERYFKKLRDEIRKHTRNEFITSRYLCDLYHGVNSERAKQKSKIDSVRLFMKYHIEQEKNNLTGASISNNLLTNEDANKKNESLSLDYKDLKQLGADIVALKNQLGASLNTKESEEISRLTAEKEELKQRLRNDTEIIKQLKKLVELLEGKRSKHSREILNLIKDEKYNEADCILEEYFIEQRFSVDDLFIRSKIKEQLLEFEEALKYGEITVSILPKNCVFLFSVADIARRCKNLNLSIDYYERCKGMLLSDKDQFDPNMIADVYNELGFLYESTKKYEEAIQNYEECLKITPKLASGGIQNDISLYSNLSITSFKMGDHRNALLYINKAIRINPNNSEYDSKALALALVFKAQLHKLSGKLEIASRILENSLNLFMKNYQSNVSEICGTLELLEEVNLHVDFEKANLYSGLVFTYKHFGIPPKTMVEDVIQRCLILNRATES